MNDIAQFVVRRLATRAFWILVVTTFLGILMYDLRTSFKDQIFQEAVKTLKSNNWKNFRG